MADAIARGDRDLVLDSLAWMEFCISIELQPGAGVDIFEIEEWLRAKL